MKKRSNAYWKKRSNLRMESYHKGSDETISKINAAYDKALEDINKDINKIFFKLQSDSGLSIAETKGLLNSKIPKKELDSIRARIRGIQDKELKRYMMAQLNANAYKARITRLEALKESIYINTKLAADVEINKSTKLYTDNIEKAYYTNLFDIQKGLGVGFNVAQMPLGTIEEILKNSWSGKHYSKRIWHNTDVLAEKLEEVITSGLMSGKSSRRMSQELQDMTDYEKFACERIIRTETTYITNAAEVESYKECGIDKVIFIATLDLRTSSICRSMDGKIIKVDKLRTGSNLPPLHPYCRSTTRAYFKNMERLQRRARDPETGKTYTVPGDMKYQEWYDKFVVDKYGKDKKIIGSNKEDYESIIEKCTSIEDLNKKGTKLLEKNNIKVVFEDKHNIEVAKEQLVEFIKLKNKYNTDTIYSIGSDKFGTTLQGRFLRIGDDTGGIIQVKNKKMYTTPESYEKQLKGFGVSFNAVVDSKNANKAIINHEFAHGFGVYKQRKISPEKNEFWKEMRSIHREYNKAVREGKISPISQYASQDIDEFMAEAFESARLNSNPNEYSIKVLSTIDKHFKKTITNSSDGVNNEEITTVFEKMIKNKSSDRNQYSKYKEILGKDAPKSFTDFRELKYNDSNEWNLVKDYVKSRSNNMISIFTPYSQYKEYKNIIDTDIIGLTTSNGIKIKGQSKHFIERVFGTSKDPNTGRARDGVAINDIKDAILNGVVRTRKTDPNSIKLVTDRCMVSINPNTGVLIQTNP